MIIITKQEAKNIKENFPNFYNGKTMENKYGGILEKYLIRTQNNKSKRGKYVLTSSIQFDRNEDVESKIKKLDELIAIMESVKGNPEAQEACNNLMVERYKILNPQWWNKELGVKHPRFFALSLGWIKNDKNNKK